MYSASRHRGILHYSRLHSQGPAQKSSETSQSNNFFNSILEPPHLVEEAEELAGNVLATGLLVVHNTGGGGENDVAELTRGKELGSPLLEVTELNGVAGVDNTALVETVKRVSVIHSKTQPMGTYRPFS